MGRGRFITLEGGEGVGKSTLAKTLALRLAQAGVRAEVTREPGGSPMAEAIREAVLSGAIREHGPFAEALMFSAARIDHIDRLIAPALARGDWVICDRFADSTRVYQGVAGELEPDLLRSLERVATAGLAPDLTLILDLDPRKGLARAARRSPDQGKDRFEAETLGFHRKLRQGFLAIAAAEPERCAVLDALRNPAALAEAAWLTLAERLTVPEAA